MPSVAPVAPATHLHTISPLTPCPAQVLKGFKNSTLGREQEVFACMVHNLFDEYRFFPKYPDKELATTGEAGRGRCCSIGTAAPGGSAHRFGASK